MRHPFQIFDDLKAAAILTNGHVRSGKSVCHDHDEWLVGWLKHLPMGSLLTVQGYCKHIAQHCDEALKDHQGSGGI